MELREFLPPPPEDWTLVHGITHLLVAVCIADNVVDDRELQSIGRSILEYGAASEEEAADILNSVVGWHNEISEADHPGLLSYSLGLHCNDLLEHTDVEVHKKVVRQMIRVANADGEMDDAELELTAQTAMALNLEEVANDIWEMADSQHPDREDEHVFVHPVFRLFDGRIHMWPVLPLHAAKRALTRAGDAQGEFVGFAAEIQIPGQDKPMDLEIRPKELITGLMWMAYFDGRGVFSDPSVDVVVAHVRQKLVELGAS